MCRSECMLETSFLQFLRPFVRLCKSVPERRVSDWSLLQLVYFLIQCPSGEEDSIPLVAFRALVAMSEKQPVEKPSFQLLHIHHDFLAAMVANNRQFHVGIISVSVHTEVAIIGIALL